MKSDFYNFYIIFLFARVSYRVFNRRLNFIFGIIFDGLLSNFPWNQVK